MTVSGAEARLRWKWHVQPITAPHRKSLQKAGTARIAESPLGEAGSLWGTPFAIMKGMPERPGALSRFRILTLN